MTAVVSTGRGFAVFLIDANGVARETVARVALVPAYVPEGTLEAVGDVLYLRVGERYFVVVVETCDECGGPVARVGRVTSADGRSVFCDASCREEWRFKLS